MWYKNVFKVMPTHTAEYNIIRSIFITDDIILYICDFLLSFLYWVGEPVLVLLLVVIEYDTKSKAKAR